MRKISKSRIMHHTRNIFGMIASFFTGFFILYKVLENEINCYTIIVNIIGCFLGLGIYLAFILLIYRNDGHITNNFKMIFDAIDKISNGDFSIFIESREFKHNQYNNFMNELSLKVNNMAKELNNMETMRQEFVSNVSHEIQSPLTSIQGFATLIKNEHLSDEEKKSYLEIIDMETKRLSKLSDNLLKLSALDSGAKELQIKSYDLGKQLRNVILSLEPQWSKKKIEFELECHKTIIHADEGLMSEVWINLINNGIKFTPHEGKMYVRIKENIDSIEVTIKDSGIGISREAQKHIFERFYMADKSRKREVGGNGLGLAITKKIVDLHKGNIKIKSELEKGTEFIISIPTKEN